MKDVGLHVYPFRCGYLFVAIYLSSVSLARYPRIRRASESLLLFCLPYRIVR